jgi:hypothetical protein
MNGLKQSQIKILHGIGCKDLSDKIQELVGWINKEESINNIKPVDYFKRDYVLEIKEQGCFYNGMILISEEKLNKIFE